MSETTDGADAVDSTDTKDSIQLSRRTVLQSVGVATGSLAFVGSGRACATDGEWYGYGDQYYGFSGYGGIAPPCSTAE